MQLAQDDLVAIWLTLKLAAIVTLLLLLVSTPLAWWLVRTRSPLKGIVNAMVALPLVLPPTVLGFYLLLAMGPAGPLGKIAETAGLGILPFTFPGLVIASMVYSLPFVVQPIQTAMQALGTRPLEVAATLGAGPWDRFFSVVVPLSKNGFINGAVMGFAHTLGEFGVVLMIGGNIPGVTRVVSVQLYDHVEALEYGRAHWLAALMVVFSFLILLAMYSVNSSRSRSPSDRVGYG